MSTTNPKNLKMALMDIGKDLNVTDTISDVFTVFNHTWEMALLGEEESNWRMSHVVMSNKLSVVASFRLPTLAIGIRKIDGVAILDYFSEDWDAISPDTKQELLNMNPYSQKYFCAEHLMKFLADKYPEGIAELWEKWQILEARRTEAIAALKKSSGESSEKEEKKSTTELSPIGGEQSQIS